jgi:dienelactone hydrolase
MWGAAAKRPAPTLIILSGAIDDSLLKPTYQQAGKFLAPQGYLCVSIDLPCHGTQATKQLSSLAGWAKRAAVGDDFVAEFNQRMSAVLDHLIAEGITDPKRIAACGTSRGGFLAVRFMAHDKRVRCAAGFSPVTDLRQLREFEVAKAVAAVDAMSLEAHADALKGRPVFVVIGDRDDRVGTDAAVRFMRKLGEVARKADVPSEAALHVLSQPKGHTTPEGGDLLAAMWIYKTLEGTPMPKP